MLLFIDVLATPELQEGTDKLTVEKGSQQMSDVMIVIVNRRHNETRFNKFIKTIRLMCSRTGSGSILTQ